MQPISSKTISDHYCDSKTIEHAREAFSRDCYVALPQLFTPDFLTLIRQEVRDLAEGKVRRNFVMPGYNTPRVMHTIGGHVIREQSPFLTSLYANADLAALITSISGHGINACRHPDEFMVINFLQEFGGTHGWHLDDPQLALVIILQAPEPEFGGALEYIKNWRSLCKEHGRDPERDVDPLVDIARELELVKTANHSGGDAYLLKADECLHRVTLLRSSNLSRIVINMGFETETAPTYGRTADVLYG